MNKIDFSQISTVKEMNSLAKNSLVSHLGIKITEISKNTAVTKMKISNKIMAPNGFIHGGSITSLADTACGMGTMYHLKDGEMFATVELKTNFISAVERGTLVCKATLEHEGKTLHVWDAKILEEKSLKVVALFRCTQMIIRQK
jgi:1,4-dihydroxy-2-naphthoyl-CoA hydrolase